MSCADVAKTVGQRALFLGVDTANWSLAQFAAAAQFARAHHIDTLFVKTADGGNRWYQWSGDNINGWRSIRQTILQNGVGAIPYTYSYGNTYNALGREIALLQEYMRDAGVVIADMEQEWNGHADWGAQLCNSMKAVPGIFLVSTWANPYDQNWQGVIQALNPCVDSYLPQQYTNYLASCWGQFGALGAACIMPTFMIGQDFGPNDAVANARAAHNQGHAALSIWYYDTAVANPGLLDQILAAFPVSTTTPTPPTQGGTSVSVPTGWKDDGKILTAPNGIQIREGFRNFVLANNWATDNIPLAAEQASNPVEISNPALGAGTRQVFRKTVLEWTSAHGVFVAWVGQELLAVIAAKDALTTDKANLQKRVLDLENAYNAVNAEKNSLAADKANLQKQVADLEAQLKAQTQAAIDQAAADIQAAITSQQNALKALGK